MKCSDIVSDNMFAIETHCISTFYGVKKTHLKYDKWNYMYILIDISYEVDKTHQRLGITDSGDTVSDDMLAIEILLLFTV